MLEMKMCCKVPFPEKLFEGYEVKDTAIYANVNASKIVDMMKRFIEMHNEPMFFILEIPCKNDDGITSEKTVTDAGDDYDVYFIDGLDAGQAATCLNSLCSFLVKDGMNNFGFGCHESREEILFGKYNVMTIYTKNADSYREFFKEFEIGKVDKLLTAWDTFDHEHPGECELYVSEKNGKTIYDIPEAFEGYGMYLYESRKEYDSAAEKEITFDELIGKVLLIGITFYNRDNEYIEQKQFYGTVTEASKEMIRVKQKDGTDLTLPPDLGSTKRARKGEYKLRSTGEVVVDPDYLVTWNVNKK